MTTRKEIRVPTQQNISKITNVDVESAADALTDIEDYGESFLCIDHTAEDTNHLQPRSWKYRMREQETAWSVCKSQFLHAFRRDSAHYGSSTCRLGCSNCSRDVCCICTDCDTVSYCFDCFKYSHVSLPLHRVMYFNRTGNQDIQYEVQSKSIISSCSNQYKSDLIVEIFDHIVGFIPKVRFIVCCIPNLLTVEMWPATPTIPTLVFSQRFRIYRLIWIFMEFTLKISSKLVPEKLSFH